jgi:hypothetical protein
MIRVFAFSTPNSIRVPIVLEELGVEYELKSVNVRKGEQKQAGAMSRGPRWSSLRHSEAVRNPVQYLGIVGVERGIGVFDGRAGDSDHDR